MLRRYLFGPVTPAFAAEHLTQLCQSGSCRTFGLQDGVDFNLPMHATWSELEKHWLDDWRPDAICVWLAYTRIPNWIWSAPVPVIGLAPDWNLLWHYYGKAASHCDLILTDQPGVERMRRAGIPYVQPACLYGLGAEWLALSACEVVRNVDIAFVGNFNPAVHAERGPLLLELARSAPRHKVALRTDLFGTDYCGLLQRSRIAFNRSVRGECNRRTFEALAGGALLFSEAGNAEVDQYLQPGRDYVTYSTTDLPAQLEYYLDHEDERRAIAAAGQLRARELSFERLWGDAWSAIEGAWDDIANRALRRRRPSMVESAFLAAHQATAQVTTADDAQAVVARLCGAAEALPQAAAIHQATAAMAETPTARLVSLRQAQVCPMRGSSVAADLVDALLVNGRADEAKTLAERSLTELPSVGDLSWDFVPMRYDREAVAWERCAWSNAGDATAERRDKASWARGRILARLADLTGELRYYYEAALADPNDAVAAAALGCALARAGRSHDAWSHLDRAVRARPFDQSASRALFQLLGDLGQVDAQRRLARDLRCLTIAAPQLAKSEPWFENCPPPGDELASIIIPCWNNLELTQACIASILALSRGPFELILIDNGSTDGTAEYFASLKPNSSLVRVDVISNSHNRGFPAACNQGLMRAAGEYIVFLNNDTVVTADWLDSLIRWSLLQWPHVGLVGPVTNYAPAPQHVPAGYRSDLAGLATFAQGRRAEHRGRALEVERISGFCLLARRDVLARVGSFDERYGLGFFDDDDLGFRVRDAGFKLMVALDTFVHHHGSRTFHALGVDPQRLLAENFHTFQTKWGAERTAGYRSSAPDSSTKLMPAPSAELTGATRVQATPDAPRTSLCMIVRNEEANLPACLDSVAGLFDEMVIVDTGSTDNTRAIAVERGAVVIDFPWIDDFAAARNVSLDHARGQYAFWMDADDRFELADRERMAALLAGLNGDNVAFVCKCVCADAEHGRSATVVDHLRLFRNLPQHRWKYRVHEQILPALRATGADVRFTDFRIHHVGYCDPALRRRKLERDLAILHREHQEHPDDPFTLFNLGSVFQELDRCTQSLPLLIRSLELSHPADSIVRKLYALIVGCHRRLKQADEALDVCTKGRRLYPDDAELLFFEGVIRREQNDNVGAEASWRQLLGAREADHFASVDAGLRGPKARHNLATLFLEQSRYAEAEAQWRAALAEDANFVVAWIGLGELYLRRARWDALTDVISALAGDATQRQSVEAELLRARMSLARKEFAAAKWTLSQLIENHPEAIEPRVILTHVLLQEGKDWPGAAAALNDVLLLVPDHKEALHNLAVVRAQHPHLSH